MTAARRVKRFLADHPSGRLRIVAGYADFAGLAWLNKHTSGRAVTVLIGDVRPAYWRYAAAADARSAAAFLARPDTEVLTGGPPAETGGAARAGACWAVETGGGPLAALLGAPAITGEALARPGETAAEADADGLAAAWEAVRGAHRAGRDCAGQIAACLPETARHLAGPPAAGPAAEGTPPPPPTPPEAPPRPPRPPPPPGAPGPVGGLPPPQWAADPADPQKWRWWDGHRWAAAPSAPPAPHRGPPPTAARRAGATALDAALFALTLGIGWLIWFAYTARNGQTPAKMILALAVAGPDGRPASAARMAARELAAKWGPLAVAAALTLTFTFPLAAVLWVAAAAIPPIATARNQALWEVATRTTAVRA